MPADKAKKQADAAKLQAETDHAVSDAKAAADKAAAALEPLLVPKDKEAEKEKAKAKELDDEEYLGESMFRGQKFWTIVGVAVGGFLLAAYYLTKRIRS
jgi:hypothetical protein